MFKRVIFFISTLLGLYIRFLALLHDIFLFFLVSILEYLEGRAGTPRPIHEVVAEAAETILGGKRKEVDVETQDIPSKGLNLDTGDSLNDPVPTAEEHIYTIPVFLSVDSNPAASSADSRRRRPYSYSTASGPTPWTHPRQRPHHSASGTNINTDALLDALRRAGGQPNAAFLRFLTEGGIPLDAFGSSGRTSDDELKSLVPCWDRDDVFGGGLPCLPASNPALHISPPVFMKVLLRVEELVKQVASDGNPFWLHRAVHILDHISAASQGSHLILGYALTIQGMLLDLLFKLTRDASRVDKSIEVFQLALCLIPQNAPLRHLILDMMGQALDDRYDKKREREDLDKAIEAYKEALESWPKDEPQPAELIKRLEDALSRRTPRGADV
ncbi:hypothetical protein FRB99_004822 [Tulasnella sp. 403]|nr:hypothetical protein FRB99_004822 [Tulasnella sp. 403]